MRTGGTASGDGAVSATPDPRRPRDPLGAPLWSSADAVHFVDGDGLAWRVVECATAHVPGARGPRCLLFLSEGIARRVWAYPATWRALAPDALETMMLRL